MTRIVLTVRRTAHVVVASVLLELALDFGAGAAAVVVAPYVGGWVYAAAGVVVVGSLPILGVNVARVAHREWRRNRPPRGDPAERARAFRDRLQGRSVGQDAHHSGHGRCGPGRCQTPTRK